MHGFQLPARSACRFKALEWRSTSSATSLIFSFSMSNCISFPSSIKDVWSAKINCNGIRRLGTKHVLNLSFKRLGSWLSRPSTVVLIFIVLLALAGRCARKTRHVFDDLVNGLNLVVTSVMCFVIMTTHPPGENQFQSVDFGWRYIPDFSDAPPFAIQREGRVALVRALILPMGGNCPQHRPAAFPPCPSIFLQLGNDHSST